MWFYQLNQLSKRQRTFCRIITATALTYIVIILCSCFLFKYIPKRPSKPLSHNQPLYVDMHSSQTFFDSNNYNHNPDIEDTLKADHASSSYFKINKFPESNQTEVKNNTKSVASSKPKNTIVKNRIKSSNQQAFSKKLPLSSSQALAKKEQKIEISVKKSLTVNDKKATIQEKPAIKNNKVALPIPPIVKKDTHKDTQQDIKKNVQKTSPKSEPLSDKKASQVKPVLVPETILPIKKEHTKAQEKKQEIEVIKKVDTKIDTNTEIDTNNKNLEEASLAASVKTNKEYNEIMLNLNSKEYSEKHIEQNDQQFNKYGYYVKYTRIIKEEIYKHWRIPQGLSDHSYPLIKFYINDKGTIESFEIVKSSGNKSIDQSLKAAVYRSNFKSKLANQWVTIS